ncbi:hypothetical protein SLE2022_182390 [Rubroshorea leprosula]
MNTNNCYCNVVGSGFRPTEDELIFGYLLNKVNGNDHLTNAIAEVDILECEPWELPQRSAAQSNLQLWYFFYQLDYKYRNSKRVNRLTKAGYWKGTGQGRTIMAADTDEKFASVKTLVFHKGRVPDGIRTNWLIHEYRLTEAFSPPNRRAYVVCRLEKKPVGKNSTQHIGELGSSLASTSHSKAADYAFTEGGPELNAPNNELPVQIQEQGVSLEANGLSNTNNGLQEHGPLENDMLSNGFTVEQNAWQAQLNTVEQDEAPVERNACLSMILAQGGTQPQANPEPLAGNNTLDYEPATQMQEVPSEPDGLSSYQNGMQEHGPSYNDLFIVEQNGWQAQMDTIEQEEAFVETNACSSMILAQGGPKLQPNPGTIVGYSALQHEVDVQMQGHPLEPNGLINYQNGMQEHVPFYNDMLPNGVEQNGCQAQLDTFDQEIAYVDANVCSSMILAQGGPLSLANPESFSGCNGLDYEQPLQMQEDGIFLEDLLEPDGLSNDQNGIQELGSFYNDRFSTRFTVEQNGWQAQLDTIEQEEALVKSNDCMSMILAQGGPRLQANPEEPLDGYKALVEPPAQIQEQGISLDDLKLDDMLSNEFPFKQNVEQAQLDTTEQDEEFVSSISVDGDDYSYEGTLNVPLCDYGLSESWRRVYNNESSETVTEMGNLQNQPVDSKGSWQNHLENGFNHEEFPNFDTYGDDLVAASPNDPNFLNSITCNSLNQPRHDNSLAEEGPQSFQLQCGFSSKETVFKDKARDVELLESSFSYKHKSKRLKTYSDENSNIS